MTQQELDENFVIAQEFDTIRALRRIDHEPGCDTFLVQIKETHGWVTVASWMNRDVHYTSKEKLQSVTQQYLEDTLRIVVCSVNNFYYTQSINIKCKCKITIS